MVRGSYISDGTLQKIDALKTRIEGYKGQKAIRLHNQRRAVLESESLNTSLYIEYPDLAHVARGHRDRETRKLLKRLETAWGYCIGAFQEDNEITKRDLEIIQGILVSEGEVGVRQGNVEINYPGSHNPPPGGNLVQNLLSTLLQEQKGRAKNLHPVEAAAYIHLHLLYIHPFEDGNGRTSRLIQNCMLSRSGYAPAIIEAHERGLYFALLPQAINGMLVDDTMEQRPFFEFIASKVYKGLERVLQG